MLLINFLKYIEVNIKKITRDILKDGANPKETEHFQIINELVLIIIFNKNSIQL